MPRHGQYPDTLEDNLSRTLQEQPDRGPAQLSGTTPGSLMPQAGVPVRLPGFDFPPRGAYAVDRIEDADIAPGASADVITLDVPVNSELRIDGIGFGGDDEVALRFLSWTLLDRNVPAQAYGNQLATVGSVPQTSPVILHARGPTTIVARLTAAATAAATYRYVVRIKGWLYQEVAR